MATVEINAVRLSFMGKDIIEFCMLKPEPGFLWQWCRVHDWPVSTNFDKAVPG